MEERSAQGRRRWFELSPWERAVRMLAVAVQMVLAGIAWWDLARRPAAEVRGPRWRWALVIAVNFVGPIAYFRWGRMGPEPVARPNSPPIRPVGIERRTRRSTHRRAGCRARRAR